MKRMGQPKTTLKCNIKVGRRLGTGSSFMINAWLQLPCAVDI